MKLRANIGMWERPFTVERNNFVHKSLSCWSANPFVGCGHACRFCYVPEVSTIRMAAKLKTVGVDDPDEEWGDYVFLRRWDREAFRHSIEKAERLPFEILNADGNRAVMFSTTTDAWQAIRHTSLPTRRNMTDDQMTMIGDALTDIRERTTLNVRILTRSPMARMHFDHLRRLGRRVMFGVSLPTLNEKLARIYEPHAPGPAVRLSVLEEARALGIPVYVAVAPVYPESDVDDMRRTIKAVRSIGVRTVFMEPINIRADNVGRIRKHAASIGQPVKLECFETPAKARMYAFDCLTKFQAIAKEEGIGDRLHLWPDAGMGTACAMRDFAAAGIDTAALTEWLNKCWSRVSEWPV